MLSAKTVANRGPSITEGPFLCAPFAAQEAGADSPLILAALEAVTRSTNILSE
jgi:hypothetical protein